MSWRPPCSTPTDTLFPYTSLCRSEPARHRRPSRPRPGRRPPVLPEGTGVGSGAADRLPELRLPRRARGPLRGGAEERRKGDRADLLADDRRPGPARSEEHTSELQSPMRSSYAVFCLKKKQVTIKTYE